jgi:hypothetical protein
MAKYTILAEEDATPFPEDEKGASHHVVEAP